MKLNLFKLILNGFANWIEKSFSSFFSIQSLKKNLFNFDFDFLLSICYHFRAMWTNNKRLYVISQFYLNSDITWKFILNTVRSMPTHYSHFKIHVNEFKIMCTLDWHIKFMQMTEYIPYYTYKMLNMTISRNCR